MKLLEPSLIRHFLFSKRSKSCYACPIYFSLTSSVIAMDFLRTSWTTDSYRKKKKALAEKKLQNGRHHLFNSKSHKMYSFSPICTFSNLYVIFSFGVCIISFQEMMEIFLHSDLGKLPKFHVKNLIQNWLKCRNCPLCWSFMNIFQKEIGACSGILLSFIAWRWLFCWLHMLYALLVRWS